MLSVLLCLYSSSYDFQSHNSTTAAGPGELAYGKEASEWNTTLNQVSTAFKNREHKNAMLLRPKVHLSQ